LVSVIEIKCNSIKIGYFGSITGTFGISKLASSYGTPSASASSLACFLASSAYF